MRFKFIRKFELTKEPFFGREGEAEMRFEPEVIRILRHCYCEIYSLWFIDQYIDLFIRSNRFAPVVEHLEKAAIENPNYKIDELLSFIKEHHEKDGYFVFFGD